ncbi:spore germination protein [Clostridiaceae bacterium 35-E11]
MKSIWKLLGIKSKSNTPKQHTATENISQEAPLKKNLQENLKLIKERLGRSSDIVIREFRAGKNGHTKISVIYTDGLVDKSLIQNFILKALMLDAPQADIDWKVPLKKKTFEIIKDFILPDGNIQEISTFEELFIHLLSGDTIILIDGYNQGFVVSSKGWEERSITEPTSQTVVRGPKDGFSETLRTNTALIRRRIKDTHLWIETKQVGRKTKTDVAIAYIKSVANDKIVEEVRRRLDRIDIDGILESGYIEELIQDETYTPFPTIYNTERPDAVAAGLLEGRVAILVDGTPFVLLVPALFNQFFQSPEDYYQRFDIGTLLRLLRYAAFFIALLTPSLYIAATTFHHEMIPTPLLISIAAQREGVPFPALVEALIMEITFEILREAGVRMPRAVGPAISIVGALVLGESAVRAGIVSPVMVIVVSLTAISSFVSPTFDMTNAVRMLRFVFMILAASFGLFGIAFGFITMVLHLCSLRSFGVPYMTPASPFDWRGQKDTFFRFPIWSMTTRPHFINRKNIKRQQNPAASKPKPSNEHLSDKN